MSRRAVILAGGRGERMMPITNTIPKALVPVNGVPILAQQLRQLERLGFSEVLILTGYLSKTVEYFCNNFTTTMKITCCESDVHDSPRQRLLRIRDRITGEFLLIYCDNFIQSDDSIESVMKSKAALTFLIEPRDEGNVKILENNRALYWSRKRSSELKFVELGNIKVKTETFFGELEISGDLPSALEKISSVLDCSFQIANEQLSSVSDFSRYLDMEKGRPKLILDRDGVLLESMPRREYVTKISEYKPLWGNWDALKEISQLGCDFIVATNQPGVALGQVSPDFLLELHQRIASDLLVEGVNILAFYVCVHHWDENCECRKPRPGMLISAMRDFRLSLGETIYIGDADKDLEAAYAAGLDGILIGKNHTNSDNYTNLSAAIPRIKDLLEHIR
jgi:D-glycero-D-manno-heptose 1,7-bisphosphate phosphatase